MENNRPRRALRIVRPSHFGLFVETAETPITREFTDAYAECMAEIESHPEKYEDEAAVAVLMQRFMDALQAVLAEGETT